LIASPELSPICFGCEPLGGTDWGDVNILDIERAIHRALELGVNFFDTAAIYGLGQSEKRLSHILGEYRHEVVIATKGGLSWNHSNSSERAIVSRDISPIAIQKDIENSLRRLRLDCLPIFFIHWPGSIIQIQTTFEVLMRMHIDGKIASIGCSNFSKKQVEAACSVADVRYIQIPLNILSGQIDEDIVSICKKYNIKIIVYNVLASGLLTGKYDNQSKFPSNDRRSRLPLFQGKQYLDALSRIAELRMHSEMSKRTLAQNAIHWVLKQPNVVSAILGIKNSKQIEENCAAVTNFDKDIVNN
jgi:aryl-alcohol dehydrogenase-like predicted oxidoreductase